MIQWPTGSGTGRITRLVDWVVSSDIHGLLARSSGSHREVGTFQGHGGGGVTLDVFARTQLAGLRHSPYCVVGEGIEYHAPPDADATAYGEGGGVLDRVDAIGVEGDLEA